MKEFKVKITKGKVLYIVEVKHKKTGREEIDACSFFPKYMAKKLKRQIIKELKNKEYKKEYEL